MNLATSKQIEYANFLLEKHEREGSLDDVIHDLNPDLQEDEDIVDWFKRLSIGEMSEVIETLKEAL